MFKRKNNIENNKDQDNLQLVILKTVHNNFELDMTKALLDENNIPYIVRDNGIGGYMRVISGSSIYGMDILVDESVYEKSKDIIEQISLDE